METGLQFSSSSCTNNIHGSCRRNRRSLGRAFKRKMAAATTSCSYQFNYSVWKISTNAVHDAGGNAEVANEQVESVPELQKDGNTGRKMDVSNELVKEKNQGPVTDSLMVISNSRVLKGIPQSPHFYPLRSQSELAKNILMNSWDRIYEETVEKIQALRAHDFWDKARELWKTLEELQNMGYNVVPLRRKMVNLTDVVTGQKLTEMEVRGLKIKAENHRLEKSRLEFVILNSQEIIRKQHEGMEKYLVQVAQLENELPKFEHVFAKLAMESL